MRPQQQNRRMRGRNGGGGNNNNNNNNNNNRRGPNPLTRNYESNGPDVKIRGSAQQIAEKYAQLARDAQSSGDRVMMENYLQHAEHYNRIIAAAQAQMPIQNVQQNRDLSDDEMDDERDDFDNAAPQPGYGQSGNQQGGHNAGQSSAEQPQPGNVGSVVGSGDPANEPQPVVDAIPAERAVKQEAPKASAAPAATQEPPAEAAASGETPAAEAAPEPKPRRGRRPRRPKASEGEEGGEIQPALIPAEG